MYYGVGCITPENVTLTLWLCRFWYNFDLALALLNQTDYEIVGCDNIINLSEYMS